MSPMQIVISGSCEAGYLRADEAHGVAPLAPEPVVIAFLKQISRMNNETCIGCLAVGGAN